MELHNQTDLQKLLSPEIDSKEFINEFNKLYAKNNYGEHFINWIYTNKIQNFPKN